MMTNQTSDPEPAEGTVGDGGDWQTVNQVAEEPKDESGKTNEEVAKEVLAGLWGRGRDRTERLKEAGYDPKAISDEIAKRFG